MRKDRRITKIISQLIKDSFDNRGNLVENRVQKATRAIGGLKGVYSILLLSEYSKRLRTEINKRTLTVESVIPVSSDNLDLLVEVMRPEGNITDVKNVINPALLGGIKVKIGDVVYDSSLSAKIKQLKEVIES